MNTEMGPFETLDMWMHQAKQTEPRVPDAMQLATVGANGRPSVRTVLLKRWGPADGLVFFTNHQSRKGREIEAHPHAAVCLHFKTLMRQVLAEGLISRLPDATSDAYFATRTRGSQIGAWASAQSQPIASREALIERVDETTARFEGQPVPRPPFWGGYRLDPVRFEFWQGHEDRIHHREVFEQQSDGWRRWIAQP